MSDVRARARLACLSQLSVRFNFDAVFGYGGDAGGAEATATSALNGGNMFERC